MSINELRCDGLMSDIDSALERREPILRLKIDVTVRHNELVRDDCMSLTDSDVERCVPILRPKVDVTASSNELLRDGHMSSLDRVVERREPMHVLVVEEGLHSVCGQQRANLRCITIMCVLSTLLPRHDFPSPSLCFLCLFPCNLCGPSVCPTNLQTRTGNMSGYQ